MSQLLRRANVSWPLNVGAPPGAKNVENEKDIVEFVFLYGGNQRPIIAQHMIAKGVA